MRRSLSIASCGTDGSNLVPSSGESCANQTSARGGGATLTFPRCEAASPPHQARVPRHVGGEYRGKATDRRHLSRSGRVGLTKSNLKPAVTLSASIGSPSIHEMPSDRLPASPAAPRLAPA
jgi:hypothetical protein